jgi:hypothetical protein
MEKENQKIKKKKKNKILKIFGYAVGLVGGLILADKCIPGFNEKITKPTKDILVDFTDGLKEGGRREAQRSQKQDNRNQVVEKNQLERNSSTQHQHKKFEKKLSKRERYNKNHN